MLLKQFFNCQLSKIHFYLQQTSNYLVSRYSAQHPPAVDENTLVGFPFKPGQPGLRAIRGALHS